jgi:hypothetical protein
MSETPDNTQQPDSQAEPTGTDAAQTKEPAPPWGSADEFNPEKAWNLIQNLRGDLEKTKPALARVKELEDATKTETQRLTEDRDSHKTRAQEAESKLIRMEVGLAKGLTPAQAKRLVGSTKEELEADADDLLATFGGKPGGGTKPTERLRGGGEPDTEPTPDYHKLAAEIPRL